MKKIVRFLTISSVTFIIIGFVGRFIFLLLWQFDIFNPKSYMVLYKYWEKGGVFNTFRDCSLGLSLFLLPILWLLWSHRLYKKGFWKSILKPLNKLYRHITNPKNLEVEHVSIKNLGGKDKTLDEIIAEKIKAENATSSHASKDLRKQISAKIEENEKQ